MIYSGQNLSLLHQYLINEDSKQYDSEKIKYMIKEMFTEIEEKSPHENLTSLIDIYCNTGTKIDLIGDLPEDDIIGEAFFEIIREAITNAIRHANSDYIKITIDKSQKHYKMNIINNGLKPKTKIVEHEGIKGVRRKITELGGSLYIKSNDEFCVEVII